jgi:hypothetical protein
MAPAKKSYATKGRKPYNKAKTARKTFKPKSATYKSDHQNMVCSTFIRKLDAIANDEFGNGQLCNNADVADTGAIQIQATLALDARNPLLASHSHASYVNLFNEWNTSAIYIDLLISKELRDNCEQLFMLVERGNKSPIVDEVQMCSDVNHKMYQLGNNTNKISFKYIFTSSADRINKKSTPEPAINPSANDLVYLKLLCKGKNHTGVAIKATDLNITARVKCYNKYRDMKVLTAGLN